MATNAKTSASARNSGLDTVFNVLNSGKFIVADGTQPTDADTSLGAQVDLADLAFGSTAFAAASAGSKAANAITQDSSANASSTATWATLIISANAFSGARLMDMSVGTSGANLNLNSVAISSGAAVAVSSLTITQAA
jgi:hypothetical protein